MSLLKNICCSLPPNLERPTLIFISNLKNKKCPGGWVKADSQNVVFNSTDVTARLIWTALGMCWIRNFISFFDYKNFFLYIVKIIMVALLLRGWERTVLYMSKWRSRPLWRVALSKAVRGEVSRSVFYPPRPCSPRMPMPMGECTHLAVTVECCFSQCEDTWPKQGTLNPLRNKMESYK